MAGEAIVLPVAGPQGRRDVRISSPGRILWPQPGITKLDLAKYIVDVGDPFVAANGDRPVSLQRFPDGVDGEQFFSKNPPKGAPEYLRSVTVVYPSRRSHPQLVIDEPAAAVWAVQMNTVVFHPWPSRVENTDNPDQLRIDLDPQPGTDFDDAIHAALELKSVLEEVGLTAFIKTSGNRGLHVFAPIEPTHEFLDVRHAVIALARELVGPGAGSGPDTLGPPRVHAQQVQLLIGLIATGGLDEHLPALQKAILERHQHRQCAESNQAAARIQVGDRVQLGHHIRPLYLHGATGTVTGWSGQSAVIQLDEPIGRFTTGQIRCPPLGLKPLPE